ncbi:periplasmic chaperone for outer membrane proteins Skp [Gelidibacter sediminis]|uniref:Periplasmic chaperone for outer membrane proteins Skp n=1 Tax=Gelidibacter sediminis TaxID=1608710 RepID=A0A4R7Q820_9FLAO|nr:OmpH family outer membrane protein [Gelidibacter sediminis]TDU43813.1 periplasmic chaperone for outer membrane proteins Skp [Gelidibacter sediminis]
MKQKVLFLLALIGLMSFSSNAQRGVRIGYIDTEYILQNVPEYQEATAQLDAKVLQWKSEVEQRLAELDQKKSQLNNERVLLTKELYEERFEDISFEEKEILDYQQKRFGPNGDLMIQKQQLIQPIQDQIFAAVQEIAGSRDYDFIFDKSADVVMLYSAERFDISELVLRSITRSSKRTQATNKAERRAANAEDIVPEYNEAMEAREKALEDKKAERLTEIEQRRAEQQATRDSLKAAVEARRQKILDDRAREKAEREKKNNPQDSTSTKQDGNTKKSAVQSAEEKKQQQLSDREARQKALDERRKKILEERKKAKAEREAKSKEKDSIP